MAETLDFKLDAFEGPLDLLLQLIEKDKVDIYDIPISSITDQYLNYVAKMSEEDLGTLSDFLVMASTLLDIKARMLLPKEKDEEGEEIDPRAELARRLQEYKEYKRVSQELGNWYQECEGIFYKEESIPEVFLSVLQRKKDSVDARHSDFGKIEREPVRIADRLSYVLKYGKKKKTFSFRSLLSKQKTRQEVIVTFLACLELIRIGQIEVSQDKPFGEITMTWNEDCKEGIPQEELKQYD